MKNLYVRLLSVKLIILLISTSQLLTAQNNNGSLEEGFKNPPESAKPRTWWHWTAGNITKEGITKDLEWMKRTGIGGMQLSDVAAGQGQTLDKKVLFRSEEWLDAVRHATSEADRLELEMSIFSSAGWSLTGGPWVEPGQAMKKLVWSEMKLKGPQNFSGKLPAPPSNAGPIRNLSRSSFFGPKDVPFYKDCIVLAFPTPEDESDIVQNDPVIQTGTGIVDGDNLLDDDLNTSLTIRSDKDSKIAWIEFYWERPFKAQALTIGSRSGIPVGTVKASEDGVNYTTLAVLPGAQLYRPGNVRTISFPETTARFYRLEFTGAPMRPAVVMAETQTLPDSAYTFDEMKFHTCARINRWEEKAGFFHLFNYEPVASSSVPLTSAVDPSAIIDITPNMSADGSIDWKVPEGNWTIMRFGYSLTGSRNRPAVPAGTGYEVDKLSGDHTLAYIKEYTRPVADALGPLYGKALQYVLFDSWEAGMQNWTDNMLIEFKNRRGYDPTPYLPCLSGFVVGNSDISDRFMWDFRRTLADMFAENHYKVITEYLNNQGIGTYGEASGVSLEILEDALLCKKYVDIPMGEFWYRALHPELMYYQDIRGAASAAHVYGKKIVAAESFTGGGYESPYTLKKIGDYWFAQGVNRIVFHTSAHQPLDTKPGNTMVGTHINRNMTWAEQAKPFMTYLARNSYMLQQGKFVADIAYLLDEGAPSTMPIWGSGLNPAVPEGYDYDYINADVLIHRMTVSQDGRLTLPDGMSYAVLVLPETRYMTLPVLQKIHELVQDGATVSGPKPVFTPGLSGYPGSEKIMQELVSDLWGDLDGISRTRRVVGKGKIIWGTPVGTILEMTGIKPDVEYGRPLDSEINWIHRKAGETDIYYVVNSSDRPLDTEIRFRVAGKEAELWDPATGKIQAAGYTVTEDRTVVPVHLTGRQSVFTVFRNKADVTAKSVGQVSPIILDTLTGPWKISFPPDMGAPEKTSLDNLESWTTNSDEGIKYFSGTAVYSKTMTVPKSWLQQGSQIMLDLGEVGDIAEVTVNNVPAGILWYAPFRTDITGLLKQGTNKLEIKVTNQWTNRLIGDMKSEPGKKVLNSNVFMFGLPMMSRGEDLKESGILGPVLILKY